MLAPLMIIAMSLSSTVVEEGATCEAINELRTVEFGSSSSELSTFAALASLTEPVLVRGLAEGEHEAMMGTWSPEALRASDMTEIMMTARLSRGANR